MPVAFPYTGFPDGQPYPQIPTGTTTVNVNSSATLNTALANAVAGHRIVLANATYSGAFAVTGKTGTSSAGIMIEAATTGGAVFASGSTWNINNSAYVTLKGMAFPYDLASGNLVQFRGTTHHSRVTRCLFGPTSIGTPGANKSPFVYMGDNTDFIRIDHNEIRNKSNPGNAILGDGNFTTFQVVKHIRIDHNYIHDIRPEVDNEKEPIRLGVSTMSKTFSNSVIERNVFANCIAEPEIVSAKACGIRISGNVFSKSIGGPVYRHGTNGVMNDNYVVDDGVSEPPPDPDPPPGRTPGVGGIPSPPPGPNVVLATGNTTSDLLIDQSGTPDNYRIYDGRGFTCGYLAVRANYVIVQNYRVNADGDLGISVRAHHATVQHCDVKNVHAPGDLNAMEVFGDDITIAYNTCVNFITGDAGGSHTDAIQTWNQRGNESTSRLIVQHNVFTGAPSEGTNTHIHQALIGEGKDSTDGGGGGDGESNDWFVADNYWTADCKFDDINNVTYTRNTMAGNDKRAVVVTSQSTGFKYYSDNIVTGTLDVGIGATVIPGPGPLTAPWLGGGTTPPPPSATLVNRVVGIPSTTSVPMRVRTSNATSVRLQVSPSSTFSGGVISGPAVVPNAQGDSQLTVSGLAAGTAYYHRVGVTSGGTEGFTPISSKAFRTAPIGQTNFSFCFASCDETSNSAAMGAVAARNDAFFLHMGDLYYNDSASSTVSQFRTEMVNKIQASNYKAVFDTTPTSYTPSDHDGMSDNGTFGTDPTGWTNWNSVYRELFPSLSFPGSMGVYKTWTWGRVRFIQLDTRSFASSPSASDNSSKTFLGSVQKQWLKDQITAATEGVIVLVQDTVWIGGSSSGDPTWLGYATERTELANFFAASGKNICMLGGDMHALAAHNGSGSPGGIAMFHGAPLSNDVSHKGGGYTVGPSPGTGGKAQQYGRMVVTDSGTQIAMAFTGYNSSNTQMVTLTKTYNV